MAARSYDHREEDRAIRWYFTKAELKDSPSRTHGVDSTKELSYRQHAANMIQDMGQKLNVSQLCINTAIVYMHRFYIIHSFKSYHRVIVAAAALFLAAKVEEQPRKLEFVAKISHSCQNREAPMLDTHSEAYTKLVDDITSHELLILETLGFEVQVEHPHPHVVKCMGLVRATRDLSQTAYFMAHNSLLLTTFCLEHKPTVVACVCIHLACRWIGLQIPMSADGKNWWEYVDSEVTLQQLDMLMEEFLLIYRNCPSRLQRKVTETMKAAQQQNRSKHDQSSQPSGKSSSSSKQASKLPPSSSSSSSSSSFLSEHLKGPKPSMHKPHHSSQSQTTSSSSSSSKPQAQSSKSQSSNAKHQAVPAASSAASKTLLSTASRHSGQQALVSKSSTQGAVGRHSIQSLGGGAVGVVSSVSTGALPQKRSSHHMVKSESVKSVASSRHHSNGNPHSSQGHVTSGGGHVTSGQLSSSSAYALPVAKQHPHHQQREKSHSSNLKVGMDQKHRSVAKHQLRQDTPAASTAMGKSAKSSSESRVSSHHPSLGHKRPHPLGDPSVDKAKRVRVEPPGLPPLPPLSSGPHLSNPAHVNNLSALPPLPPLNSYPPPPLPPPLPLSPGCPPSPPPPPPPLT